MKKIAIVYMAHDGFTSLYTGVGSVARDFLFSFPEVSKNLKNKFKGFSFDLYATTIKYNEKCFGFSEDVKKATQNIISKNKNIHLIELLNGSDGDESYATIDYWKFASISGATFVYVLSLQYDKVIVVAVDTPFAQVGNYFFKQHKSRNVAIAWLPQSTVLIHRENPIKLIKEEKERYEWEKDFVDLSKTNNHVFLSYVGEFMKRHLMEKYGARPDRLVSLRNSLYLNKLKSNITSQKEIKKLLVKLNVPTDRPLIFSFGRAEYYKGLDLVVANSLELIENKNFYTLILCSSYNDNKNDPEVKKLKKLQKISKNDIGIITSQDFHLPHLIMQWEKLNIIAVLSRAEPFGLIPIESRFYNNKNSVLVVSSVGGLPEQVVDGKDGFVTSLNKKSIKKVFNKVAELSSQEKIKISKQAYNRINSDYDQIKVDTEFISKMLSLT